MYSNALLSSIHVLDSGHCVVNLSLHQVSLICKSEVIFASHSGQHSSSTSNTPLLLNHLATESHSSSSCNHRNARSHQGNGLKCSEVNTFACRGSGLGGRDCGRICDRPSGRSRWAGDGMRLEVALRVSNGKLQVTTLEKIRLRPRDRTASRQLRNGFAVFLPEGCHCAHIGRVASENA